MEKFLSTLGGLIAGIIIGVTMSLLFHKPVVTTGNELVEGIQDTVYVPGDTVYVEVKTQHSGETISQPLPILPIKDEAYFSEMFLDDDLFLTVNVTTYPAADSIHIKYFADLMHRSYERTDTVFITRIDTLVKAAPVSESRPFFDSFEFGFGTAATIVAAIILIIK